MAYELRALRRQKIIDGDNTADNVLTASFVKDGAKVEVDTSATISIYKPGVTTAVVSGASMTISGSLLTYQVDASGSSYAVGEGWRGEITVVHGADTHNFHILFDVVNYVLRSPLTFDQLVDRDDTLRSADWNGDGDMSNLIEACRDELQIDLESLALDQGRILEDMVLDVHKFAVVHRLYVLWQFWAVREGDDDDRAEFWERRFSRKWKAFVNSIKWDANQDGEEDASPKDRSQQRLIT